MNIPILGGHEVAPPVELPLELWRVVFSYMPVMELCRCCQVCKVWNGIVASLDNTVWKRHFLSIPEWRHPYWPRYHTEDPICWQKLYRQYHMTARIWRNLSLWTDQTNCTNLFSRHKDRKIITVGKGCEHESLKSALSVACEYDRILISPGIYDEQFEMSSKIPFELMGAGELGSVVLVMCIEQNALTGRLCNLLIKAPWFTGHVVKVMNGHLQVDNCILEDGQVIVQNPGTCHFRYCSFHRLQMSLLSIPVSLIENCEFVGCDTAAISVEGYPGEHANWAHQHLKQMTDPDSFKPLVQDSPGESMGSESLDEKGKGGSVSECNTDIDSIGVASIAGSHLSVRRPNGRLPGIGRVSVEQGSRASMARTASSYDSSTLMSGSTANGRQSPSASMDSREQAREDAMVTAALAGGDTDSEGSNSSSDVNITQLTGSRGQISNLWSDDEEFYVDEGLQTSFSVALQSDPTLLDMVRDVQGCVIRCCRVVQCHGAVIVSRQGQLRLEQSELSDVQYGIRCLQNAKVALLENEIHHCSTSAIFMRLAAHGLIAGNDIYCTSEAGIDIRKNADPIVQCNKVHHSKRSGIVVLGSGCGTIKANDIYQNREAGLYILYRGNPYVSGNRIVHGGAAGIAVNEEGRGYIVDNLISGNRWGGIDIRHGSDPQVCRNLVCNGLADGIIIGHKGRGTIEGNTIKGNVGCGVWVMGSQPVIRVNQIYNNNDTGVSFVQNKENDEDYSADDADDSTSEQSLDLDNALINYQDGTTEDQNSHTTTPLHPQLTFNTIYHNNGYGVLAHSAEFIYIGANAIHANRNIGILVKQSVSVTIENNSVTGNEGAGLLVAGDARVKLEGNGIYDNTGHGAHIQGEAILCKNDIFANHNSALFLEGAAEVKIEENRIHAPLDIALKIEGNVKGVIERNQLYPGESVLLPNGATPGLEVNLNKVIEDSSRNELEEGYKKDWHLEDPSPRPHIEAPPTIVPREPVRRVTTVTRLVVPSDGNCSGSKLCIIL